MTFTRYYDASLRCWIENQQEADWAAEVARLRNLKAVQHYWENLKFDVMIDPAFKASREMDLKSRACASRLKQLHNYRSPFAWRFLRGTVRVLWAIVAGVVTYIVAYLRVGMYLKANRYFDDHR